MTWTVTKESGAVSFSSWLAQEAAAVEAEQNALLEAFRAHPPLSLKPPPCHEPDPFLSELPWQNDGPAAPEPGETPVRHDGQVLHRRIAAMAHEFNNLLTVIIGNLDLVEAALHGDSRAEDSAAEAVAAAQRGAELTRRLMALARGQPVPTDMVVEADSAEPAAEAPRRPEDTTVLVVEDEAAVRATAVGYLRGFGYRVIEAPDAVAALKLLQDEAVDVLFTDVVLPGAMNGFDLSQAACLIRPGLRIIHASGYPKDSPVYQDEPRLSDNFIAKPYRRQQLRRVLEATLADRPGKQQG